MKNFIISSFIGYQRFISPIFRQILGVSNMCRFFPSCSQYTILSIKQKGVIKGLYFSLLRFISCQPFFASSSNLSN